MLPAHSHRLFRAIVVMGVSLTGGAVVACGGSDVEATPGGGVDAPADASHDACMAGNPLADAKAAEDTYVGISSYLPDVYSSISADAQLLDQSSHDARSSDAADEPDCYPCIHPAGDF